MMNSAEPVSLEKLVRKFQDWDEGECPESVSTGWNDSMEEMPSELSWLAPEAISAEREFGRLTADWDSLLHAAAQRISADPYLSALAWHAHNRAFRHPDPVAFISWPTLERPLGKDCRLFYLLIALSSFALTRHKHKELGVPVAVTQDTCQDVVSKCLRGSWTRPDLPGLEPRELGWFQHHTAGQVFTVGRLQYWPRALPWNAAVYRHVPTGKLLALAPDGTVFDSNGLRPHLNETVPSTWTAQLSHAENEIRGHPIHPTGFAERSTRSLPRNEWRQYLVQGDPVFEIHIPAGGKMTLDLCRESMIEARALFKRIFPDFHATAFVCNTWFLGPQMRTILPPKSNILKFQEASYLLPVQTSRQTGLIFLFGQPELPRDIDPADTSLRRTIWEHIRNGGDWRGGTMFYPVESCHEFGKKIFWDDFPTPG